MSEFSNGEVVQLKSGGPKMTITSIYDKPNNDDNFISGVPFRVEIYCKWFDAKNTVQTDCFYPESLIKV